MQSFTAILSAFAHDAKLGVALALIAVDFLLGVAAAARHGTFRLSYVADFARQDVLGKVFPWFVLYAADKATSGAGIVAGLDLGDAAMVAWIAVSAALTGSILASLADLGLPLPSTLAAGEKTLPAGTTVVSHRRR